MKTLKLLFICIAAHMSSNAITRISQRQIPFTITRPGTYALSQDITYTGKNAAITIETSNVYLSGTSRTITLSDPAAHAIKIHNKSQTLSDITLEGGTFTGSHDAHKGVGLSFNGVQKVALKNISSSLGMQVSNASSIMVEGCDFVPAHVAVQKSSQVTFKDTVFSGGSTSLVFSEGSRDGKILNCSFSNADDTLVHAQEIDGLLMKESSFADSGTQHVLLGFIVEDGKATASNNTRIEGCTFINTSVPQEGVLFYKGSGLIVESCLFELIDGFHNGALHLERATSNSAVRGCTFKGAASAIRVSSSTTLIEDCVITGAQESGIVSLPFSSDCTIRNCNVSNNNVGISLDGSSHIISDTACSDNQLSGMEVAGTQQTIMRTNLTKNKVGMYVTGSSCALLDNIIASNAEEGVVIKGEHNALERNTVYNNGGVGIVQLSENAHVENNMQYHNKAESEKGSK